jgi:aminoglycoside phosphotransferase (APT) family kinase protein
MAEDAEAASVARSPLRARFLRIMARLMGDVIRPRLASGELAEQAFYMDLMLARLAAEDDVVPAALVTLDAAYRREALSAIALIRDRGDAALGVRLTHDLASTQAEGLSPAERLLLLRGILTAVVRHFSGSADPAVRERLAAIMAVEAALCDAKTALAPSSTPASGEAKTAGRLTPEAMTAYLRSRFPEAPAAQATSVEVLAGGRSKTTIFVTIEGVPGLPGHVVMRQDGSSGHIATSVVDEFPLLSSLADRGLPIPAMLLCEREPSALGKPFMLMGRLPGRPAGTFSAFEIADKALVADTARALAALHRIDPASVTLPGDGDFKAALLRDVVQHECKYRAHAVEPSPIIDYGYDWVHRNIALLPDANAIVHGDYRPHNFLVADGRLSAVLDWEFAHLGDGAEDLAYYRPTVTPVMPWGEFMGVYHDAGGGRHEERTLLFYDIWNVVRLAALGAAAVRGFIDGETDDFCQGAGGYFITPMFEASLAYLLRQADALDRAHP